MLIVLRTCPGAICSAMRDAVAATDTFALYNTSMGTDPRGGISRQGASGSFTYPTRTNMEDKPVNFASGYDALRFANWMHNGQPTGAQDTTTTEDEKLLAGAADRIATALRKPGDHYADAGLLKAQVKDNLSVYLYEQTRRRPLIFPVIVEV